MDMTSRWWMLAGSCALLVLTGACTSPSAAPATQGIPPAQVDRRAADANQAIYDFLGQPVPPPTDLNFAYSKEGLTEAVQRAAQSAGISLTKVEIDDSEFPALVGVICEGGKSSKLVDPLKKMPEYSYGGSVDSDKCRVMTIIPPQVFPRWDADRIERRLTLRMQILYDRMMPQDR